ncbi:MAG: protein kinase [Myxococcota bacterium]|nr:protein kinase [Myxococcota bacterium]
MIGTKLDKYEIVEKIGEGGMATVYEGRHQALGRKVAIKVLHPHLSSAEKNRERFAREARTIERLEHGAILRIFDYSGPDAEKSFIVTELIEGETLKELTERLGLLPSELVALIGLDIAGALAYAHDAGIIHRDIKPENIMIRNDGSVKVMDFGIARFLEESAITMTGSLIGSPAYMSPEQVLERKPDTRSDLFSLGALLFRLVTGQLAFPGSNPSVTLKKVIEGDHPRVLDLVPTADTDLANLIEQLLSPDPAGRPSHAAEVVSRLGSILQTNEVDRESAQFSTLAFLRDPPRYEMRLREHHNRNLLERGKAALQVNDHQRARQIFNRLLAINPDHPEVLELLANVATQGESSPRFPGIKPLASLVLLTGVGLTVWAFAQQNSMLAPQGNPAAEARPAVRPSVETPISEPLEPPTASIAPATSAPQAQASQPSSPSLSPQGAGSLDSPASPTVEPRTLEQLDSTPSNDPAIASTSPAPDSDEAIVRVGLSREQRGVWADVYIDGKSVGRTRGGSAALEIEVSPGTHTLKITNDYALAFEQTFVALPGESVAIEEVVLQKRPVRIQVSSSVPNDCVLVFKGRDLGTLEALSYQTRLSEASDASQLHIRCVDGTMLGPYRFPSATPGEVLRMPPMP